MADLRAEQVIDAVVAKITAGGTSAGANVFDERVDPAAADELPCVGVFMGEDRPTSERGRDNATYMDSLLGVGLELGADGDSEGEVRNDLSELRKEVHALMMDGTKVGLAWVIDVIPAGAEEPEFGRGDRFTGSMVVDFIIHYRHSVTDASEGPSG